MIVKAGLEVVQVAVGGIDAEPTEVNVTGGRKWESKESNNPKHVFAYPVEKK